MARRCSTICLAIDQDSYRRLVDDPAGFRAWLDQSFRDSPELFPKAFAQGYRIKDDRVSAKTGLRIRRVRLNATGQSFSVRPSFVLPYQTALADDVADALFLRCFGVPFWAIAKVFGKDHDYWLRLEVSLGRNSIVGTALRKAGPPEHVLADEHHQTRDGQKNYVATTVGAGCCLGAALAQSAGTEDLQAAYGVFKEEAQNAQADYQPQTVSVDGWAPTHQAWLALFPLVALLRCFLHGWLNVRSRGKLNEAFAELSGKVWEAFAAPNRRTFAQRMRRLWEWAVANVKGAWLLEQVEKMCKRKREYGEAYGHEGGHRTSNMLDRVMRSMSRYFEDCQHLHGSKEACELHCRAWALLYNFRPWHKATERANEGWRSPAERLNQHRYHDGWLQNLLVSASLGGYRC
ncbi:MAG TPA: hypothetical protein VKD72_31065 [Gemmataceae bacterium]|nr:hypothetical protein [Gemmataceae bacterium]